MRTSLLFTSFLVSTNAFTAPMSRYVITTPSTGLSHVGPLSMSESNEDASEILKTAVPALTSAAVWAMTSTTAMAAGPDWGIFEGRTGSLLHPLMMGGLLAFSISTALLGFDWRRQRTIGDEISEMKKTMPDLGDSGTAGEALRKAEADEATDAAMVSRLRTAVVTEANIKELQLERKGLAEKSPRDNHFSQGAMLAFLGTLFAIEGPLNTYARAGKLFPGPHLYAGAGLVCLWALAAACVPAMQKGNDTARTIHIGANVAGIGMFGWQVVSGIPILLKVVELTKWP